ncbi:cysteine desulfurase [Arthrobacter sp. SLBN-83]|uniref:cysteine desulfurase family protein n=1 Tax=Arthrobacter sp. SLBN-83 TaxID=2768449 RepID=UPI00114FCDF2|nr:aminotransferase class V-fold PLP-dependent enzyme [Arthrobacter sp. SLBN-83]TQJ58042.1 cysteine desulfurase [Arthrobacter sp. SLBN-83]
MANLIYLDAAASTPIAPEALEATVRALKQTGNAGASHAAGLAAAALLDSAREAVAELLRVGPAGVTFVASATEANNLALRGLVRRSGRCDIVTSVADHPSVLATVEQLASEHGTSHALGVGKTGEIDVDQLEAVLSSNTALVSVHAANNETGVIQPLDKIVERAHEVGALVHADASQLMAWGAHSILDECDMVTVSSHKMHGPQGAAALIVRPTARNRLRPQLTGGGQERGLRSGSANSAAIAGFGAAAELALSSGYESAEAVRALRRKLLVGLKSSVGDLVEHGADAVRRLPGILNVAVGINWSESVESEALLARLPRLAASTGSACHAGAPGPSPVLLAMGVSDWEASRSIRLSLSRYTTNEDVEAAIGELGRGYVELVHLLGGPKSEERFLS